MLTNIRGLEGLFISLSESGGYIEGLFISLSEWLPNIDFVEAPVADGN